MRKTSTLIVALVMLMGSSSVVSAKFPDLTPGIQKNLGILGKVKLETAEEKCARITQNIENRTKGFDENKDRHYEAYKNLKDRMEKFVAKLTEKGYDVTELKADLVVLNSKIQKFADDYAAYQAKLGETKDYACGHSDGDFKAKLQEARVILKTVREDSKDIKNYYLNTIKPDLKAIRAQKPKVFEGE
jgi:hypothetical protein